MQIAITEMFSGFGLLTEALLAGLRKHHDVAVAACAEMEPRYLAPWSKRHPEASTFCGSVAKFHPAELSTKAVKAFRLLVAGIPCTGASVAGRSKNRLKHPEEHQHVGHLFLPVAHYIRLHRPDGVIFENVPPYARSLSARILRKTLARLGYSIFEVLIDPHGEFDTPSRRLRWCLVALRRGPAFTWGFTPKPFSRTLRGILDEPSERDQADAFSPKTIAAHRAYIARKQAEGCGFDTRLIDQDSTKVPTICKSYGKVQPSATFVRVGDSYRMIRPRELARIMGFPDSMPLPESKTTAYEVFGQGVCYKPFHALGEALGAHLAGRKLQSASAQMEFTLIA